MINAAYFCNRLEWIDLESVYSQSQRDRIAKLCNMYPDIITSENINDHISALSKLDVIFSTWGMPNLTKEQLAKLAQLKAVFYAAGSVKDFATPFLERDITVVSAWAANAVPVAEFTVAQILLANKGYFRDILNCTTHKGCSACFRGVGNYNTTIALLGVGMIAKKVIELLKPFCLKVLAFDPFLSREDADHIGVEKVSLDDAFRRGMVISNHIADIPETRGMLRYEHFDAMRKNAVFINTGRGATLAEEDIVRVFRRRTDLTALLDVTNPEPPAADSPFYELPNIILSSHIAGSIGEEVTRMAETIIEEFLSWSNGGTLRYAVTPDMLKTMA